MEEVGVREFRAKLPGYLTKPMPVAVTRHGRTLGYYVPSALLGRDGDSPALAALRSLVGRAEARAPAPAGSQPESRAPVAPASAWSERSPAENVLEDATDALRLALDRLQARRKELIERLTRRGARNPRLIDAWDDRVAYDGADVRLLVDRTPPIMSVLDVRRIGGELSRLLGLRVDVYTPETLPVRARHRVLAAAVPL